MRAATDYILPSLVRPNHKILFNLCGPLVTKFTENCAPPAAVCDIFGPNTAVINYGNNPPSGTGNTLDLFLDLSFTTANASGWRSNIFFLCGTQNIPRLVTEDYINSLIEIEFTTPLLC